MKKILFLLFTLLMLTGCGKDEDNTPPIEIPSDNNSMTEENIFKETGCKPKDIKSIKNMRLFVDSLKNERYLYGAKMKNDIESFWVAKFTSQGEQIWETIKVQENHISNASKPYIISTGDLVFQKVLPINDYQQKETSPVLINSKDGTAKFINIFDGYIYSDIYTYKDFFFCSISQKELDLNTLAKKYYAQIDNEGNILNQDYDMNIPNILTNKNDYSVYWKDYNTFIIAKSDRIYKSNVSTKFNESSWDFSPSLPTHSTCKPIIKLDKDTVTVNYNLILSDGKEEIYNYKLSYTTGKDFDNIENPDIYKYLELNIPYIAPDSMTVTLHSIDVSDNGQGTTYYMINYTLENKTNNIIITEGTFEAYLSKSEKGEFQTGAFDNLYPGENINRTYVFRSLSNKPYLFIQYKHDWRGTDADILKKSLKWEIKK